MKTFDDLKSVLEKAGLEWTVAETAISFLRRQSTAHFLVPAQVSTTQLLQQLQTNFPEWEFTLAEREMTIHIPQTFNVDQAMIYRKITAALQTAGFDSEDAKLATYEYSEVGGTILEIPPDISAKEILRKVTGELPGMDIRLERKGTRVWLKIGK